MKPNKIRVSGIKDEEEKPEKTGDEIKIWENH